MRRIAVLDAPSNLGLRPPTPMSVPGCAKAPGALRDQGLLARLGARDAGCLTPPRYDPGDWRPGDGVCHAAEIADYSLRLADRIGALMDAGELPLVLGGDCSVLIGSAVAMHRYGAETGTRTGLVFVDGHSDFRHPGNASYVGAAAGEDLALVTGRGQPDLTAIEGRRPYFRDLDVVVLGIRAHDEYRLDLQAAGIAFRSVPQLRVEGAARSAQWARDQLADCAGYWVHVDVDVLDPAVMPAVDAPDPGGIAYAELELLLAGLVATPRCLGLEVTVFDPDYDLDGGYAAEIVNALVSGLAPAVAAAGPGIGGPGAAGPGIAVAVAGGLGAAGPVIGDFDVGDSGVGDFDVGDSDVGVGGPGAGGDSDEPAMADGEPVAADGGEVAADPAGVEMPAVEPAAAEPA
ncbi:MAG TPA: arginase family protein [Micromonosporaceae bacterium]|nr:arginase family protein [Micromonosporaceae bacterium]